MSELKNTEWYLSPVQMQTYFGKTILNRGWKYYLDGEVSGISREGEFLIKAKVSGSSRYRVTLDCKSFHRSDCSCPYGAYCKHMAAVLFEVAKQDGYDPRDLMNGGLQLLPISNHDLTPKQAMKLPDPTDTCEDWLAYFHKQYGSSRIYNAFGIEEVTMRAWGQLHKLADAWEPTIRCIYDILVVLYLMKLCDSLAASRTDPYDFYQVDYYFMRVAKHNMEQLAHALQGIDADKARRSYFGHLKELVTYLAENTDKATKMFKNQWLDIYKMLWSSLLFEESLVKNETARLRHVVAEHRPNSQPHKDALIRLVHFDIMNGDDENAWERITKIEEVLHFEDWSGYMRQFIYEQQWERLVSWLRWLAPQIQRQYAYDSGDYLDIWNETAMVMEVETEYREVMAALLPGSYRHYACFLLLKEEYGAWVDLCLLLNLSPSYLESSDLKIVEKADIRLLLPLYHYATEACIQGKNRADYKEAVKLLKKLATAYKKLKQTPRFEAYVDQLSKQYSRYRAFQEELRKGKLIL